MNTAQRPIFQYIGDLLACNSVLPIKSMTDQYSCMPPCDYRAACLSGFVAGATFLCIIHLITPAVSSILPTHRALCQKYLAARQTNRATPYSNSRKSGKFLHNQP